MKTKKINLKKIDFKKMGGLVPAVIQDSKTKKVLMLGFMNEESLAQTLETGFATFWSRTRNCLWQKGETSGNRLNVVSIVKDCDNDSLLVVVQPEGPTCHTGALSCFDDAVKMEGGSSFLDELYELISDRKKKLPNKSYTTQLFKEGAGKISKKINEEAFEVIMAATSETKQRLIEESGDLLYHLLVLLAQKNIDIQDVIKELKKRYKSTS